MSENTNSLPCYPCVITPEGTTSVESAETLYLVTESGGLTPWRPDTTPEMASPSKQRQKRLGPSNSPARPPKKNPRFRNFTESDILNIHNDSGSDGDDNDGNKNNDKVNDDEQENDNVDFVKMRRHTRRLRDYFVQWNENVAQEVEIAEESEIENESVINKRISSNKVLGESNANERGRWATRSKGGAGKARKSTTVASVDANFSWSEDFSSFTGQKEEYSRVPGPTFSSQNPADIFHEIWDHEFMEKVVRETNTYAWEVISQYFDSDTHIRIEVLRSSQTTIPDYLKSWTDVTVEELYRYFAILILLPLCHRIKICDYWKRGVMGMPGFRSIMTRNRFFLINNFLHFVPNVDLLTRGHDRKIEKIASVLDHCNRKFARMYTPSQHLSLDESLLLGKRRLSSKQCKRSKAASFGIKSVELCEAETGYLLQYRLYTDKKVEMHHEPLHGFRDHTEKNVLDLIEGYLDVGHVLVMDNWYNQLPLTRYLKTRHTDVLGTINRRQQKIPHAIKDLTPNHVDRGRYVSRHSGDIALVAYKDVKLVTVISTYHQHVMCLGRRSGQDILEPAAVEEYNRYMGGVDLKDQKLSLFPMERRRVLKWYMKVFRMLLNTSLLNAFIIYTRNPVHRAYSHRDFRLRVTEGLLNRYPAVSSGPCRVMDNSQALYLRLQPGNHFPIVMEVDPGDGKAKRRQLRCVRCTALKRRSIVSVRCKLCQVPLCVGPCWKEYHTMLNLKSSES